METILVVEDNEDVNRMLSETLGTAGYTVKSVFTGTAGIAELKTGRFQLVLLDLMLPYKSGDQLLKELRTFSDIPVIVISAKTMIGTKVDILKLGADDYITKPFDLDEVTARVETNLRRLRRQQQTASVLRYKDIVMDTSLKQVTVGESKLVLTAKEYKILEMLLQHSDKVFTKANLYESVWRQEYLGDDNAVKTHISNLRSKLKNTNPQDSYIETMWGLGYRLYKD